MNTLELKNKIIRQIDSLNEADFEKVYQQLLNILESSNEYRLSEAENEAIDSALKVSEDGVTYSHDQIISDARIKFPNLKFR
jgi:hypothetical protein